ncbi:MAG: DUF4339 domain-containing protein [Verrucomicrobia bacterium]|nr:DUF4339 domain-containing protein [Verrucomicrobiota bacterium]MBI3870774.1 DUF4339 domain-containing protein [Verrucomicrobiota bacterium]
MNWYYAKDGQQAGPVDETELATLVAGGAIQGTTLVWKEGMPQWMPYRDMWQPGMPDWRSVEPPPGAAPPGPAPSPQAPPESPQCSVCRNLFGADDLVIVDGQSVCAACKPILLQRLKEGTNPGGVAAGMQPMDPETLVQAAAARTERFSPTDCVGEAWRMFKNDPTLAILSIAAGYGVMMVTGFIPILNWVLNFVVNPPIMAGIWLVYIRSIRGEQTSVGDVFSVFSKGWGAVMVVNLLTTVLTLVALVPAGAPALFFGISGRINNLTPGELALCVAPAILFVPLIMYLSLAWMFALPLAADRGYGPWESMTTSMRVVNKNLLTVFVLSLLCGVLVVGGVLALCVGLIVAVPLMLGSLAVAYEEMFGSRVRRP